MNPDSDPTGIANLLRASPPEVRVPVGMETRILRAVEKRRHPSRRPVWFGLATAAAVCLVALLMCQWFVPAANPAAAPHEGPVAAATSAAGLPPAQSTTSVVTLVDPVAPLETESGTLMRDARRAGGFLIECLPTLSLAKR